MASSSTVLLPELTTTHILRGTCDLLPRIFALKPGEYILSPIKVSKGCLSHPFYRSLALFPFYFKLKMGHVYNDGLVPGLVVDKIQNDKEYLTNRFKELNTREGITQFIYDYLPFVAPNYVEGDHFDVTFYVYFHWEPIELPKKGERVVTLMGYTRRVFHKLDDIYLEEDWEDIPPPHRDCGGHPCERHDWIGLGDGTIRCDHDTHLCKYDRIKTREGNRTILKEEEWEDGIGFFHIVTYNDGLEE